MTAQTNQALTVYAQGALDMIRRFGVGGRRTLMHRNRAGLRELERAGLVTLTRAGDRWLVEIVEVPE